MKQLITICLLALLTMPSCKKEPKVDEVTYEVILTNSATWHGSYLDENAQAISITNAASNWSYKFKNTNDLAIAVIQAYPDGLSASADATMRIYVNGNKVAEGKSSVFPQLQYQFP